MALPALNLMANATARQRDPTSTITLRKAFAADATMRLRKLKRDVWVSVVDRDALGIGDRAPMVFTPAQPGEFAFLRGQDKINGFMDWLREQEENGILEITQGPGVGQEPWSNTYIRSSYQRGLARGSQELRKAGIDLVAATGQGSIQGLFFQPFHADRVGMIYSRTFDSLKGITAAMDGHISRELALGLAQGKGPEAMARAINKKIDNIGIVRSRMIARTEVVQTFNEAALNEYEQAELITGRSIDVIWNTSLDERVRDRHILRHGKRYKREVARGLLGEPNCRCWLAAHIDNAQFRREQKQDIAARKTLSRKYLGKSRKERGIV
jgi:SPP1 gp7 family putative phage head morphogenesis protein